MTDLIYSNIYLIFSVIIYLILTAIILYKLSGSFKNFVSSNIFSRFSTLNVLIKVKGFWHRVILIYNKFINTEIKAGDNIKKTEVFVSEKLSPLFTEPVNILSLLIRKIFTDNISVVVTFASAAIVVFYIILTVL